MIDCCIIVRGVYFALPVNSFKEFYIVQYLLFELPTFLFFTIYTIILYLWYVSNT